MRPGPGRAISLHPALSTSGSRRFGRRDSPTEIRRQSHFLPRYPRPGNPRQSLLPRQAPPTPSPQRPAPAPPAAASTGVTLSNFGFAGMLPTSYFSNNLIISSRRAFQSSGIGLSLVSSGRVPNWKAICPSSSLSIQCSHSFRFQTPPAMTIGTESEIPPPRIVSRSAATRAWRADWKLKNSSDRVSDSELSVRINHH